MKQCLDDESEHDHDRRHGEYDEESGPVIALRKGKIEPTGFAFRRDLKEARKQCAFSAARAAAGNAGGKGRDQGIGVCWHEGPSNRRTRENRRNAAGKREPDRRERVYARRPVEERTRSDGEHAEHQLRSPRP